jgi:ATP-dependent DNA helicase RecQ
VIKPDLVTPVKSSGKSTSTRLNLEPRFAQGQSIEAIQQATGLAASTISQYLSEYVRDHPNTDVTPWVRFGVIERVQSVINLSEDGRLKPIYEALNAEVPYDQIRLAMSAIVVREDVSALD